MAETIDVLIEDPRWETLDLEALSEVAFAQLFELIKLERDGYELAILACDDVKIAELNTEFRDKAKATNVLSWPSEELAPDAAGEEPFLPPEAGPMGHHLGDIAISYDTCVAEAGAAGKSMPNHVTHLLVHGCLHLLGYDHETDADATRMEGIEVQALAKLGIDNPY
jgi:probable rRNA maturation factor